MRTQEVFWNLENAVEKSKLDINRPMRQSPALIFTQLMQYCFYLNQVILSHLNDSVFSLELSVIVSSVILLKEKSCRFRFTWL